MFLGSAGYPCPRRPSFILLLELRGHLRREVLRLLLDALAELEAQVAGDADRPADLRGSIVDDLGNLGLAVHHEGLLEQYDFLVELADAALDHLGDDVGSLARLAGLLR